MFISANYNTMFIRFMNRVSGFCQVIICYIFYIEPLIVAACLDISSGIYKISSDTGAGGGVDMGGGGIVNLGVVREPG